MRVALTSLVTGNIRVSELVLTAPRIYTTLQVRAGSTSTTCWR